MDIKQSIYSTIARLLLFLLMLHSCQYQTGSVLANDPVLIELLEANFSSLVEKCDNINSIFYAITKLDITGSQKSQLLGKIIRLVRIFKRSRNKLTWDAADQNDYIHLVENEYKPLFFLNQPSAIVEYLTEIGHRDLASAMAELWFVAKGDVNKAFDSVGQTALKYNYPYLVLARNIQILVGLHSKAQIRSWSSEDHEALLKIQTLLARVFEPQTDIEEDSFSYLANYVREITDIELPGAIVWIWQTFALAPFNDFHQKTVRNSIAEIYNAEATFLISFDIAYNFALDLYTMDKALPYIESKNRQYNGLVRTKFLNLCDILRPNDKKDAEARSVRLTLQKVSIVDGYFSLVNVFEKLKNYAGGEHNTQEHKMLVRSIIEEMRVYYFLHDVVDKEKIVLGIIELYQETQNEQNWNSEKRRKILTELFKRFDKIREDQDGHHTAFGAYINNIGFGNQLITNLLTN